MVQEGAGGCRRVQEGAGGCRRVQEGAGGCRRLPQTIGRFGAKQITLSLKPKAEHVVDDLSPEHERLKYKSKLSAVVVRQLTALMPCVNLELGSMSLLWTEIGC